MTLVCSAFFMGALGKRKNPPRWAGLETPKAARGGLWQEEDERRPHGKILQDRHRDA